MHIFVGAIFVLYGAAYAAYVAAGAAVLEREPPLVALGVLLVAVGAGLSGRSRAASLVARVGLGATLLSIGATLAMSYFAPGSPRIADDPIAHFHALSLAITAAAVAFLFLLVRRALHASAFGTIDLLPLAGLAAAMTLAVIWLVGGDARLRPCRLGNDGACASVAIQLLESVERVPAAPPTRWEERAARVLDEHGCRGPEPGRCGVQLYAVGTVAVRARRNRSRGPRPSASGSSGTRRRDGVVARSDASAAGHDRSTRP